VDHFEDLKDEMSGQDRLLKEKEQELMMIKKEMQIMREKSTTDIFV